MPNLSSIKCACCEQDTEAVPSSYDGEEKVICDDCDQFFTWCEICQTHNHHSEDYSPCRHLHWDDEEGDWRGSGSHDWGRSSGDVKAMLGMIGIEAAKALKIALEHHRYWHQFSGTIFGYGRLNAEWVDPITGKTKRWGHVFDPIFASDAEYSPSNLAIARGVSWIVSLWSGCGWDSGWKPETEEADLVTAKWIDEWLTEKRLGEKQGTV